MVSGALGLLGFLLAFVIGVQVTRFDGRRVMVVGEANAIGSTYLRAGYLPDPFRTDARVLIGRYVDVRLQVVDPAKLEQAISQSQQITTQLWARPRPQLWTRPRRWPRRTGGPRWSRSTSSR